jgi:hypothetical protein
MSSKPLLHTQPITTQGHLPSRELVEIIQRLKDAIGGAGGSVSDGDKGDIVVSGAGAVWELDAALEAALLSRANHTGTQAAATISDLAATVQAYTLDLFADPVASVNFNGQQALSFVIENRTSDPGSPTTGQIWLRTDL